jgi:tripartite-type tricarboxylate transporter receptor subunit TctC
MGGNTMRKIVKFAVSLSVAVGGFSVNAAAEFPEKEVTIVVGFTAGGLADQGARIWAKSASEFLGKTVVILNKPGSVGVIAANEVAKAKPDGYTLNFFTPGPFLVQPHFAPVPYKVPDSFIPIITQYLNPIVIAASADAPFSSLKELIAYAKQNPGKVRYSSSGAAGIERFAMERLQQTGDMKLTIVPFNSSGDATTALLGKHVELTSAYISDLKRYFESGQLKPIAALGYERSDVPNYNVPTAREQGVDVVSFTYSGLLAPKGTPASVVKTLHDAFKKAQDTAEFKEAMSRIGMGVRYMDGAAFLAQIKKDYEFNAQVVKSLDRK